MKTKNGAQRKSAMSELLSKQTRNEANKAENTAALPPKARRGYIETLDAPAVKKAAAAPVSPSQIPTSDRRIYSSAEKRSEIKPQTQTKPADPRKPAAVNKPAASVQKKKKPASAIGSTAVAKTAKLVRIAIAAVALICLCTCIISAVLLSDSDASEPKSDAVLGVVPDADDTDSIADLSEPEAASFETPAEDMHRVDFTFYKKDSISCYSPERTVGELIDILGIQLDENELSRIDMNELISGDTEINVDCVEYGTDTVNVSVDYETRYIDVQTIPRGTTKVYQQGANGTKAIEYTVTYLNGVECEREQTGEYTVTAPTERIVYRGVGGTVTVGGATYNYSYYIDCKSTVYTGGGTCATGVPASENVIAVDPRVIPLGTRVYVDGVGLRTAADTGGSIKGNFIDIYYEPGNTRFIGYGIKNVRVYIF